MAAFSVPGENGRSVEGRQWLQEAAEVKLPRCPSRWDGKSKDYSVERFGSWNPNMYKVFFKDSRWWSPDFWTINRILCVSICLEHVCVTTCACIHLFLGGGNSNVFYVHPFLGKWSNLTNIVQRGWNHQLDYQVKKPTNHNHDWSTNQPPDVPPPAFLNDQGCRKLNPHFNISQVIVKDMQSGLQSRESKGTNPPQCHVSFPRNKALLRVNSQPLFFQKTFILGVCGIGVGWTPFRFPWLFLGGGCF